MITQHPDSTKGLLALALCLAICIAPSLALGATEESIFGGGSPLKRFRDFLLGPFAYTLVIGGLAVTGAVLVFGGEMNSFGRRMVIVVLAGGVLLFANSVLENLFAGRPGASLAPHEVAIPWTEPETIANSAATLVVQGAQE